MKAINFLRFSKTYGKECVSRKRKIDAFELIDQLVAYLSGNYESKKSFAEIKLELENKGIFLSGELIRRQLKQIEYSFRWLIGSETEKKKITDQIAEKSPAYSKMLMMGIESLEKDGLTSWEQIKKMVAGIDEVNDVTVSEKPAPESISKPVRNSFLPKEDFEIKSEKIKDILENLMFEVGCLDSIHESTRLELSECLDQADQIPALRKEIDWLKKTIAERENFLSDKKQEADQELQKENAALLEELEKSLSDKEKLETALKDNLIGKILEKDSPKIVSESNLTKPVVFKATVKNLSDEPQLPKLYMPVTVRFLDSFLKSLEELRGANGGVYKKIVKAIEQICSLGVDNVSYSIKTIANSYSPSVSPKNCLQVFLKKQYRMTLQIHEGQVTFYELFHRSKSPFSTK